MNKLKAGIAGAAAAAILLFLVAHFHASMLQKDATLAEQTRRIEQLEVEHERLSNLVVDAKSLVPQPGEPSRELLRLRGEIGVLKLQTNDLVRLRQDNIRLSQAVAEAETNQLPVEDQLIVRQTHSVEAMTKLLHAIKIYAAAHNGQFPANLDQLILSGDLGPTNLAGNLRIEDFEFGQGVGKDPAGHPAILKLRAPIPKPGGGAVMIVGGIDEAGVPQTTVWNVAP